MHKTLAGILLLSSASILIGQGFIRELEILGPKPSADGCPDLAISPPPPPLVPNVNDYVELRRSTCYGRCPAYTVRIQADGQVTWHGRYFVQIGESTAAIAPEKARALIEKFRTNGFWNLCDDYSIAVTDSSTVTTTVHIGDREKQILDYADSAPSWFRDLDTEIDKVAETDRWIHGDPKAQVFALVERSSPDSGAPAFHFPISNLRSETYEPKAGLTPLMRASVYGEIDEVKSLIAAKADANAQDSSGWTALIYATAAQSLLPQQVREKVDIIRMLLAAGANPNARSAMGQTPAMAAASSGRLEVLRPILDAGGDINAQDKNGQTALMFAVNEALTTDDATSWFQERAEMLTFMRTFGARADLSDKDGFTVLDQLEDQARLLIGSEAPYDKLRRILRDLIPGSYPAVKVRGRLVGVRDSAVSFTAVTMERAGTGVVPAEALVAADGSFEFNDVHQGVYTLRFHPSPDIELPPVRVSVTNHDVTNLDIAAPAMQEIIVESAIEGGGPAPVFGLIFFSINRGTAVGRVPDIEANTTWPLPPNIRAAVLANGNATKLQIVRMGGKTSDDLSFRVWLPSPYSGQNVAAAEALPNGTFRITLPEGEYTVAAVFPTLPIRPVYSVKSIIRGSTDLLVEPLKISGKDPDKIHITFAARETN